MWWCRPSGLGALSRKPHQRSSTGLSCFAALRLGVCWRLRLRLELEGQSPNTKTKTKVKSRGRGRPRYMKQKQGQKRRTGVSVPHDHCLPYSSWKWFIPLALGIPVTNVHCRCRKVTLIIF